MMNMSGNVGGAICPAAIGYILYWSHNNWNLTFYVSAAIYLMGIVCWKFLDPATPLEKIRNIQESLKKPSIGSIWCCGLSRILPFKVSQCLFPIDFSLGGSACGPAAAAHRSACG